MGLGSYLFFRFIIFSFVFERNVRMGIVDACVWDCDILRVELLLKTHMEGVGYGHFQAME